MIRPIASYAAPAWSFQCKTQAKRPEAGQNKILRSTREAHRYMSNTTIRNDLQMQSLTNFIRKSASKIYTNLHNIPNEIIYELSDYVYFLPANRKRPRAVLIHDTAD